MRGDQLTVSLLAKGIALDGPLGKRHCLGGAAKSPGSSGGDLEGAHACGVGAGAVRYQPGDVEPRCEVVIECRGGWCGELEGPVWFANLQCLIGGFDSGDGELDVDRVATAQPVASRCRGDERFASPTDRFDVAAQFGNGVAQRRLPVRRWPLAPHDVGQNVDADRPRRQGQHRQDQPQARSSDRHRCRRFDRTRAGRAGHRDVTQEADLHRADPGRAPLTLHPVIRWSGPRRSPEPSAPTRCGSLRGSSRGGTRRIGSRPTAPRFRSSVAKLVTDVVRDDRGATRSYLLHCERSSGQYLYDALLDAGAEFGIEPTATEFR